MSHSDIDTWLLRWLGVLVFCGLSPSLAFLPVFVDYAL
jgi:hypothetical protein